MLVTVTSYLRVHRDEVILARLSGNSLLLRFASMKSLKIPVDDLTDEARRWLIPSVAPRDIPTYEEYDESEENPSPRREEAR